MAKKGRKPATIIEKDDKGNTICSICKYPVNEDRLYNHCKTKRHLKSCKIRDLDRLGKPLKKGKKKVKGEIIDGKYHCVDGSKIKLTSIFEHFRTAKHLRYEKENNVVITCPSVTNLRSTTTKRGITRKPKSKKPIISVFPVSKKPAKKRPYKINKNPPPSSKTLSIGTSTQMIPLRVRRMQALKEVFNRVMENRKK
jgi:hypothetical protein